MNQGLELSAGQTVRQSFSLEVGQVSENITVSESVQLVQTATATPQESIGTLQVTDLPLARRNVVGPTLFSKLRGARGLKAFREEGAVRVHYLVSQDRVERKSQGIEYIHWETFLKKLWADFPK